MGKYTKNAKGVIHHLFQYKMGQNPEPKMDNYVYETFDAFVRNKEHIVINLNYLRQYAKESMYKLIVHSIEENNELKDDSDKTNLIRPIFAAIFKKIQTMHIDASSFSFSSASHLGMTLCNSFSLIGFLSVLQASEWQKVTIRGEWISKLWQSSKRAFIEKRYKSSNYKITFDKYSDALSIVLSQYETI